MGLIVTIPFEFLREILEHITREYPLPVAREGDLLFLHTRFIHFSGCRGEAKYFMGMIGSTVVIFSINSNYMIGCFSSLSCSSLMEKYNLLIV
jgi:hypothetical protein